MSVKTVTKRFFAAILIAMGLVSTIGSTNMQSSTYKYVDAANGSDSNTGATTASALKTIQKAVSLAKAGDTIVVRAGTYNENVVVTTTGTAAAPIKITNFSGEVATLNGGSDIALRTSGTVNYWTIEGLTIRSTNRYTLRLGWWGEPLTDHWTLKNNKIFGANFLMGSYHLWENNTIDGTGYAGTDGDAGISDGGTSHNNTYRYNTVKNFSHVDARGIWTQGKTHDSVIEYNIVDNISTPYGLGQCIDLDGAAQVEWRHTVRGNVISNCSYVGIQLENVFDSVVENNTIKNSGPAGIIVISYDAGVGCLTGGESNQYGDTNGDKNCQGDPTNNIIRQNSITTTTSWGWGYGGIMNWYAGAVKVWGNSIRAADGAANGGINFQGTASQIKGGSIVGNVISQGTGPAICFSTVSNLAEESNNLYNRTNSTQPIAIGSSCNTSYSISEFQSMTGLGQNTLLGDPAFKNGTTGDLRLLANSAAIDNGKHIGTITDADGKTRMVGLSEDIGAYEYGSIVPTATAFPSATPVASFTPTSEQPIAATTTPTNSSTDVPTQVPTAIATSTATTGPVQPTHVITTEPGNTGNVAIGKTTKQSSTFDGAVSSRAVDGNVDGNFANLSVTHTQEENQPYWEVDLGKVSSIDQINIWNRSDCCEWRLTNFYIFASDQPFTSADLNATLSQSGVGSYNFTGTAGKPTSIKINRTARYIRIQLAGRDSLSLAEVEVISGTVITQVPSATSSPTSIATSTSTKAPTFTKTPTKTRTFTATKRPTRTKTPTATRKPTRTFTSTATKRVTATKTFTPTTIWTATFPVVNTPTPFVFPTEVIPSTTSNLAIGKNADQSSMYQQANASLAVDGNTDGNFANNSVTHTLEDNQSWWQVDLGANHALQNIRIWTRSDCCEWRLSNFYVFVSDVPFSSTNLSETLVQPGVSNYYITGSAGRPTQIDLDRTGRYIRIQLSGRDSLSLAEVEIIGTTKATTRLTYPIQPLAEPTLVEQIPTMVPTLFPTEVPVMPTEESPTIIPSPVVTDGSDQDPQPSP